MKKNWFYLFALICSVALFTACSDDDEPANWQKLPTEAITAENLTLTTNSQAQTNASATLAMIDAQTGTLTLTNAIRGLDEVSMNVTVSEQNDGSFQFQGSTSVAMTKAVADLINSIDVTASGTITLEGTATVNVTTAANGYLVKTWNLCDATYTDADNNVYGAGKIRWTASYESATGVNSAENIQQLGTLVLHAIMQQVLKDVEFRADGAIVASYASEINLSQDAIMGAIFGGGVDVSGIEWISSPANLAYWYPSDNNINVVLDIPSIIAQALQDQGGDSAGMAETIMAVLEQLQNATPAEIKAILANLLQNVGEGTILANLDLTQIADEDIAKLMDYLTNGFPLKYDITTPVLSDGVTTVNDIYVYLDKDFMDILMPAVAPLLASPELDTIVSEAVGQYWSLVKMLLGINSLADINDIWASTTLFKVGLDLSDGSFKVPEAETSAE